MKPFQGLRRRCSTQATIAASTTMMATLATVRMVELMKAVTSMKSRVEITSMKLSTTANSVGQENCRRFASGRDFRAVRTMNTSGMMKMTTVAAIATAPNP